MVTSGSYVYHIGGPKGQEMEPRNYSRVKGCYMCEWVNVCVCGGGGEGGRGLGCRVLLGATTFWRHLLFVTV